MGLAEAHDAFQRALVGIRIEPKAGVGDASAGLDRRRLENHVAETADRKAAVMDEMPVVGAAVVVRRVLAHGRDDNAGGKRQIAEREWLEKGWRHGFWSPSIGGR